MSAWTIALGVALVIVGGGITLLSDSDSVTSLIPAFVGIVFVVLGVAARVWERGSRHVMHASVALALLLVLASIGTVAARGASGWALASQVATIVLCAGYVALGVRSFIQTRRAREAG